MSTPPAQKSKPQPAPARRSPSLASHEVASKTTTTHTGKLDQTPNAAEKTSAIPASTRTARSRTPVKPPQPTGQANQQRSQQQTDRNSVPEPALLSRRRSPSPSLSKQGLDASADAGAPTKSGATSGRRSPSPASHEVFSKNTAKHTSKLGQTPSEQTSAIPASTGTARSRTPVKPPQPAESSPRPVKAGAPSHGEANEQRSRQQAGRRSPSPSLPKQSVDASAASGAPTKSNATRGRRSPSPASHELASKNIAQHTGKLDQTPNAAEKTSAVPASTRTARSRTPAKAGGPLTGEANQQTSQQQTDGKSVPEPAQPSRRRSPSPSLSKQGLDASEAGGAPTKFSSLGQAASAALARRSPSPASHDQSKAAKASAPPKPGLSQGREAGKDGNPGNSELPSTPRVVAAKDAGAPKRNASPAPSLPSLRRPNHPGIAALLTATTRSRQAAMANQNVAQLTTTVSAQPKRELSPQPAASLRTEVPEIPRPASPSKVRLSDATAIASEAADLGIMHPATLRQLCLDRGLSSEGLRTQLISRLLLQSITKKPHTEEECSSPAPMSPRFAPFNAIHKSELQAACSRQGLPESGTSDDLLYLEPPWEFFVIFVYTKPKRALNNNFC